ncbi:hypothetical protein [Umezakia ovalisporum]|uniref:Uncharacterized protein n=2 Tax=Umezakia ovalisporum TaxID=75695 RepID=A0AA43KDK0_9CYAN|nr:hypothetical protein [Umezakia ovalisporum]MDH6056347.1 hypothetical protein [Umezakia ovalisporum FSS-43]MDH6062442.1 hypothetical protein [Umezakia ovalisporum FSS-62]MDH6068084.1 hypothetical protein [Umezakia ovalisporum APH033B]MDH6069538.1 hypothetical protein [Umezakia ovalisporum CobakiLakeA]MDH6073536.1 hypothetical protein [Umezakia ovalisporum CS-1034]
MKALIHKMQKDAIASDFACIVTVTPSLIELPDHKPVVLAPLQRLSTIVSTGYELRG